MYHVFIVNDQTFKTHLEYLFAGTGYRNVNLTPLLFPNSNATSMPPNMERTVYGLVADVSRIRANDKVLFYLTQTKQHEGMFFGVFKVKGRAFFERNGGGARSLGGKILNFRVLLEPLNVFSCGITEREALDNLCGITHPSQMCWSLIYRKLKGNRGCTMITDYEGDRLCNSIAAKNNGTPLISQFFSYDKNNCNIIPGPTNQYNVNQNNVNQDPFNLVQRIIYKSTCNQAYEAHLQAYILQCIDKKNLSTLLGVNGKKNLWIGNEVSCGVGMQSIDIMTMYCDGQKCEINIIELKYKQPNDDILNLQLPKYIDWVEDYLAPLYKKVDITPVIIAKDWKRNTRKRSNFISRCKQIQYSTKNLKKIKVKPVKFIAYNIDLGLPQIGFKQIV